VMFAATSTKPLSGRGPLGGSFTPGHGWLFSMRGWNREH